ncbi:MAG: hypothetical protein V3U33_00935 [candidate division NC10 bacterium]
MVWHRSEAWQGSVSHGTKGDREVKRPRSRVEKKDLLLHVLKAKKALTVHRPR